MLSSWVLALGLVGCGPAKEEAEERPGGEPGAVVDPRGGETGADDDAGEGGTPTSGGEDMAEPGEVRPRETQWRTVVDGLAFPEGVSRLQIGGEEFNGNFANRGDVEVRFDQDAPVITIEVRVFDFNDLAGFEGDEQNPGTVDRLSLWAYAVGGNPAPPNKMAASDDCTQEVWKDGCQVRVYYDGQSMPVRAGADLRVHLPRSYRGELDVITEDNLSEIDYPRLGDVIVDGLCGGGLVSFAQGTAEVKLCEALTPAPGCAAEDVAACESFVGEMGEDAAWSPLCPCSPELYGQLKVESRAPWAGDITIDMPLDTWVNVHAANEETDKPHACSPSIENCAGEGCVLTSDTFASSAEYNYPSPAAPAGAGYSVTAVASGCGPVEFYAAPADWSEDSEPETAEHGHVRVCSDCL